MQPIYKNFIFFYNKTVKRGIIMNNVSKQLVKIARQLVKMQNNKENIKVAGFWSKVFAQKMDGKSKQQLQKVIVELTDDNCVKTIAYLLQGRVNSLDELLAPLKNTKQTNKYYDMFIKWFRDCYSKLPKSVINKAKNMQEKDLINDLKNDDYLKKIVEQFSKEINKIKDAVQKAKEEAGMATQSWQQSFSGWGGFQS